MRSLQEISIRIDAGPSARPADVGRLALSLEDELRAAGADSVERPLGSAQPGAKGDVLAWGELIVAFSGGLPALVAIVRSWRGRRTPCRIVLEVNGDRLTLDDATPAVQRHAIDTWLSRRAAKDQRL